MSLASRVTPRVVKKDKGLASVHAGVEDIGGHIPDRRGRDQAGLRRDKLRPLLNRAADLVLPAAAGGEDLFQPEDGVEQLGLGQHAAHELAVRLGAVSGAVATCTLHRRVARKPMRSSSRRCMASWGLCGALG